jgi:hypothetical protein
MQEARDINPLQLIRRKEPTALADIFDRFRLWRLEDYRRG